MLLFSKARTFPSGKAEDSAREIPAAEDAAWDELVAASPHGSVFLRSDWLRMLDETGPAESQILRLGVFDEQGRMRGGWALPVERQYGARSAHTFDFFYSGPVLAPDLCEEKGRRGSERQQVLTRLARAVTERLDLVVMEAHPEFHDARPFLYENWIVSPDYTHLWDLSDPDAQLRAMNREKRAEIRRASSRFRIGREELNDDALDAFLALYRIAMSKFSWYPTRGWEKRLRLRARWMAERDGCRYYAVRSPEGETLAAMLVLLSPEDGTCYYWHMGYGPAGRKAEVVPALYWQTALDIRQDRPALTRVNFGGSPLAALSQFKDYLGAASTEHYRLIYRRPSANLTLLEWRKHGRDHVRRLLATHPGLHRLYELLRRPVPSASR